MPIAPVREAKPGIPREKLAAENTIEIASRPRNFLFMVGEPAHFRAGSAQIPPARAKKGKIPRPERAAGLKRRVFRPGNWSGTEGAGYGGDEEQVAGQQAGGCGHGEGVLSGRIGFSEQNIAGQHQNGSRGPERGGAGCASPPRLRSRGGRKRRTRRRRTFRVRPAGGWRSFALLRHYLGCIFRRIARRWRAKSIMPLRDASVSDFQASSRNWRVRASPTAAITFRDWLRWLISGDLANS